MSAPSFGVFRSSATDRSAAAGDVIFEVGDAGDCLFAVQSGEVDLIVGNQVVETVQAGGIFGEMSLIDGESRAARAVARTRAELAQIDAAQFEFMLRNTPNFALNVLRLVSRRLREMDRSAAGES